ncbi:hypothetical protein BEWA_006310 [Theileria equi strain WA]|uniref:RAP domain-containing protein n=1 Tax=Theileria equi strain WA TaxID=1537102 RepID=L0B040_THEEQ|nr:hypothetical protein BEWA_006310 [Theileria equi strain WA]AFZ81222.1 hypothetical protein BEWA_006310 [Theileria equi strain WA]|eukprot:XP_004830888.1 hypothetical protein BEWA_006310 [Theileria equi strain WA]
MAKASRLRVKQAKDFNSRILSYVKDNSLEKRSLTVNECLELFELQTTSLLDRNMFTFASHIFSLIKAKYKDKNSSVLENSDLDVALRILLKLSKCDIYYPELMNFVSKDISQLTIPQLLDFIFLSNQGKLRSKHHLDKAYTHCLHRINELEFDEFLKVLYYFSYYAQEYKNIFLSHIDKMQNNLSRLSEEDMVMLLNVSKLLYQHDGSTTLRDLVVSHINHNIDSYDGNFLMRAVSEISRGARTKTSARLLQYVTTRDYITEEFQTCQIATLINFMTSIVYWRRGIQLLTNILNTLALRIAEIAKNKNIGIWSDIYNNIYITGWFSLEFMRAGMSNIVMEEVLLHQGSPYSVLKVLQAFHKVRFFHYESYLKLLHYLDFNSESLQSKPNFILYIVFAAADANIFVESLYRKSFDLLETTLGDLELDAPDSILKMQEKLVYIDMKHHLRYIWPRDLIIFSWSFAVMELHKTRDLSKLLRILLLPQIYSMDMMLSDVLMTLEVAEALSVDNVEPELCKRIFETYGEKMRELEHMSEDSNIAANTRPALGDKFGTKYLDSDSQINFQKARYRIARNVKETMHFLGRDDLVTGILAHKNSPYVIDICLVKESKKGILLLGGRELMRNHYDGRWTVTDTGSSRLKRRVFQNSGWRTVDLNCTEWAKCKTSKEKRSYAKKIIDELYSIK